MLATHVKVGKVALEDIPLDNLQFAGVGGPLEPPAELEHHAGVEHEGDDGLGRLDELPGEVPGAKSDLEHDVGGLDAGLLDDGLDEHGVIQHMLPLQKT